MFCIVNKKNKKRFAYSRWFFALEDVNLDDLPLRRYRIIVEDGRCRSLFLRQRYKLPPPGSSCWVSSPRWQRSTPTCPSSPAISYTRRATLQRLLVFIIWIHLMLGLNKVDLGRTQFVVPDCRHKPRSSVIYVLRYCIPTLYMAIILSVQMSHFGTVVQYTSEPGTHSKLTPMRSPVNPVELCRNLYLPWALFPSQRCSSTIQNRHSCFALQ